MSSKKSKKPVDSDSDSDSDSNDEDSNDDSSSSSDSNSSGSDNSDSDSSDDEIVQKKTPVKKKGAASASKKKNPSAKKKKAVVSSSDDDSDGDNGEFDDGYDDDMMGDEEDRLRLEKMSELDRETELERRHDKRKEQQMISRAKKQQKKEQKEETPATPRAVSKRRTEQDKERNKKSEVRKELLKRKSDMEKKKRDLEQTKDSDSESEKKTKKKRKLQDDNSSDSDDEVSEYDSNDEDRGRREEPVTPVFDKPSRSKVPPEKLEDADVKMMRSLHMSRELLIKWVDEPYFEEAVVGSYVRVCLGQHPLTKNAVYLLTEVVGVTKKNNYAFGNTRTDKGLLLAAGNDERSWRMDVLSNSRFEDKEVVQWHKKLRNDGLPPFTKADALLKLKQKKHIDRLYVYSNEDIEGLVQKKKLDPNFVPSLANQKSKLKLAMEHHVFDGNNELAQETQKKIKEIDAREEERKLKRAKDAFVGKLLNQRNKMKNDVRDAFVAPKKGAKAGADDMNPFQRRDCRPSISWAVKGEQKGDETTAVVKDAKAPTPKAETPKTDESTETAMGKGDLFDTALTDIKNIKDTKGVDEFEEFIQINTATATGGDAGKDEAGDLLPKAHDGTADHSAEKRTPLPPKEGRKRKGLSLKDYMKKAEANQSLEE